MSDVVLIAGASGLVGTAAIDSFTERGDDVIALSRRRPEPMSDRPFRHVLNPNESTRPTTLARNSVRISHRTYLED